MKYLNYLFIMAGLGLFGCGGDPIADLGPEDSWVFITNHDQAVDFRQYRTFSIVDSVLVISNRGNTTSLTEVDIRVMTAIIAQMEQAGYTLVSRTQSPDLGINVAQIRNSFVNAVSQPIGGFWGNYWGFGPGWGGGFGPGWGGAWGPGFPSYFQFYEVTDNYWYWEILDFKNPNTANSQVPVIWTAQVRGRFLFESLYTNQLVQGVFTHSPYLTRR
jgi:hypothetical protein